MKRRFRLRLTPFASTALIILVAVAFLVVSHAIATSKEEVNRRIDELKLANSELRDQIDYLEAEIDFANSKEGIELYARALGMCKDKEIRYSAGN